MLQGCPYCGSPYKFDPDRSVFEDFDFHFLSLRR